MFSFVDGGMICTSAMGLRLVVLTAGLCAWVVSKTVACDQLREQGRQEADGVRLHGRLQNRECGLYPIYRFHWLLATIDVRSPDRLLVPVLQK